MCEIVHTGLPREPADFVTEAVKKGHPGDIIAQNSPKIRKLLENMIHQDVACRYQKRAAFMKKWLRRLELKAQEEELPRGLPAHLQPILKGKRLLLWKEILMDLQYPNVSVIDDAVKRFKLTGLAPRTNVFDKRVRKPSLPLEELKRMAPGLNAAVLTAMVNVVNSGGFSSGNSMGFYRENMGENLWAFSKMWDITSYNLYI